MRPNVLGIFSFVALVAAVALAIQQSPNFSSHLTGVSVRIAEPPGYRELVVPLPYREEPRIIRAPVPSTEIATAWSSADQPGESMDHTAPATTTTDGPAVGR